MYKGVARPKQLSQPAGRWAVCIAPSRGKRHQSKRPPAAAAAITNAKGCTVHYWYVFIRRRTGYKEGCKSRK